MIGESTLLDWEAQCQAAEDEMDYARLGEMMPSAIAEIRALQAAVRNQAGDNLCHLTGSEVKIPPAEEFLESCRRYHTQIASDRGVLQGARTIAQLEAEVARLEEENFVLRARLAKFMTSMATGAQPMRIG